MILLSDGVRFNEDLYLRYRRVAGTSGNDGVFDITNYPNGRYCFVLGIELGTNGRVDSFHPLFQSKIRNKETNKEYVIDGICVHFFRGYYYHATAVDENRSHTTLIIGNINCTHESVIDGVCEFMEEWEIISSN